MPNTQASADIMSDIAAPSAAARQFDQEVGFALLTLRDPDLASAFSGSDERDGYRAVQAVLRTGLLCSGEVASEIERLYAAARGSLAAVWPAVRAVARALLEREQIDGEELLQAIRGNEVFAVQEAHGLRSALGADSVRFTPNEK